MKTSFLIIIAFVLLLPIPLIYAPPEPDPSCKSGPRPDGEGWVFIDCKWQQYADVPVENCNKGSPPANKYAWNSQDCIWEWSPLRNENKSGPAPPISNEPEPPTLPLTQQQMIEEYCKTGIRHPDMIGIPQCIKEPQPSDFRESGDNASLLYAYSGLGLVGTVVGFFAIKKWRNRK